MVICLSTSNLSMFIHVKELKNSSLNAEGIRASRPSWNLSCWFLWREENRRTRRKTFRARTRTNNKLNPHVTPGPGRATAVAS